jgi:hypothetical protein
MTQETLATIPAAKLERFLTELANLTEVKDRDNAFMRFQKRFSDMLTDLPSANEWCEGPPGTRQGGRMIHSSPEAEECIRVGYLSAAVTSIWRGPTPRERQFRALLLHRVVSAWKPAFLLPVEQLVHPGPFEQAILHLLKSEDRALVCGNPECPAPLFFRSRTKRRQEYCSPKCSGFGQRVAKRKWWATKGESWRNQRQERKRQNFAKRKETNNGTRKAR